jgi:hypothetical protein
MKGGNVEAGERSRQADYPSDVPVVGALEVYDGDPSVWLAPFLKQR